MDQLVAVVEHLAGAAPQEEDNHVLTHDRFAAASGALLLGLAVALGAFGAHSLKPLLTEARLGTFETAVRYQFFHGLGLLLIAALRVNSRAVAISMLIGIGIFAGSLYGLVAGGPSWFGAIAPIGGAFMILSWGLLFVHILRSRAA